MKPSRLTVIFPGFSLGAMALSSIFAITFFGNTTQAQVAIKITGENSINDDLAKIKVNAVENIHGQTWLGTSNGLYRLDGNKLLPIFGQSTQISNSEESNGTTESTSVLMIKDIDGQVWLGTERGAYVIGENNRPVVKTERWYIYSIEKINGNVWIDGLGYFQGDVFRPIKGLPSVDSYTYSVKQLNGQVWVIGGTGIYKVTGDTATPLVSTHEQPNTAQFEFYSIIESSARGDIWAVIVKQGPTTSTSDLYHIDENGAEQVRFSQTITGLWNVDGQIWVGTTNGIFRIQDRAPQFLVGENLEVWTVSSIDGRVWVGTKDGAYRFDGQNLIPISLISYRPGKPDDKAKGVFAIRGIVKAGGGVWLEGNYGTYYVEGDKARRVPDLDNNFAATGTTIKEIDGQIWLKTGLFLADEGDAYRIDKDVRINVVPKPSGSGWLSPLINIFKNVWLNTDVTLEPKYERISDGTDPYHGAFDPGFILIMDTSKEKRDQEARQGDAAYYKPERIRLDKPLGWGNQTIYYSVRDKWGNTFQGEVHGFVIPSAATIPLLLASLWFALLSCALALAPYSIHCHRLLMNPWVRKFGSFGLIPLALTVFPPINRHVLKRYFRGIKDADEFSDWQTRFVIPTEDFLPESFGTLLRDKKKLLLLGQSGIGKSSYFKFLTGYYARRRDTPPKGTIPVYLPLARYQGKSPEDMFFALLANYGNLTDIDLNKWFLQQGGFALFIDGLNEVDESTRNEVNSFIDQHWKANCFCISSQQSYPEFAGIERIRLASLSEDKIKDLLERRLGKEQAQDVIHQFAGNIGEIYNIPQDLEFAIELRKRNPTSPIPVSKIELYEAVLSPILSEWVSEGHTDYPETLFRRAYEMLCSHDAFFDNSDIPIPDELIGGLVDVKLLTKRSEHFLFRHDLVRAYLASKYFGPRWQTLLSDEKLEIDVNWRPMVEFVFLNLSNPDEARALQDRLLARNKRLSGEIFTWMTITTPTLCDGWATDFKLKFADAMLY